MYVKAAAEPPHSKGSKRRPPRKTIRSPKNGPRKAAATTAWLWGEFEFGFFLGGVLGLFLAVEEVGEFEAEIARVGGVGKAGI